MAVLNKMEGLILGSETRVLSSSVFVKYNSVNILHNENRVLKVPGSYLSLKKGYPEGFRCFPQSLQANAGIVPDIRPRPLPSAPFPIYHSHIILSFDAI
jgi:hypothetical protein